jgi:predicted nucleic acid-binding protein
MKALDTGILRALLEGSERARELVRRLRGAEIATTEANLLELAYLSARAPRKGAVARLAVLEKLRQRVTVLPIDSRATEAASARIVRSGGKPPSPTAAAMLGALEAAGCEELLTDDAAPLEGEWSFKIRPVRL